MPDSAYSVPLVDTQRIESYLRILTQTDTYRTHNNIPQLDQTAAYIQSVFSQYSPHVNVQEYTVNRKWYKNVSASFGTEHHKRIIIGAHYDVCGPQPGADDNASGIVGLLELARLLHGQQLNYRIDLVAYSLEEPPYFRTQYMGSYIHAQFLTEIKADVYGMVALDMIGYFKDEPNSQSYPVGFMSLLYGSRGNFITLVRKFGSGTFARRFCQYFKAAQTIRTVSFTGPKLLLGIDFSDHRNYWKFGYSALMITDTAFYRNPNYHQHTDTLETLDLTRMAKVIDGVFQALLAM